MCFFHQSSPSPYIWTHTAFLSSSPRGETVLLHCKSSSFPSALHSISFLFLYSPPFFIASFFTIFLAPAGTYHLQKFALLLLLVVGESTWTGPSKGSRGWFYGLQLHCAPSIPIAHRGWCPCQTPVPQGPVVYFPIEYINSALWAKWERKRSKALGESE